MGGVDDCVVRDLRGGILQVHVIVEKMQMRVADTVGKGCAVVTAVSVWSWNGRRFKVSVGDRGGEGTRARQDHLKGSRAQGNTSR